MIMGFSEVLGVFHWVMLAVIIIVIIAFCSAFSYCVMSSRVKNKNDLGVKEKEDFNHLKNVDLVGNEDFGHDGLKQSAFMNKYAVDPFKEEDAAQ